MTYAVLRRARIYSYDAKLNKMIKEIIITFCIKSSDQVDLNCF